MVGDRNPEVCCGFFVRKGKHFLGGYSGIVHNSNMLIIHEQCVFSCNGSLTPKINVLSAHFLSLLISIPFAERRYAQNCASVMLTLYWMKSLQKTLAHISLNVVPNNDQHNILSQSNCLEPKKDSFSIFRCHNIMGIQFCPPPMPKPPQQIRPEYWSLLEPNDGPQSLNGDGLGDGHRLPWWQGLRYIPSVCLKCTQHTCQHGTFLKKTRLKTNETLVVWACKLWGYICLL